MFQSCQERDDDARSDAVDLKPNRKKKNEAFERLDHISQQDNLSNKKRKQLLRDIYTVMVSAIASELYDDSSDDETSVTSIVLKFPDDASMNLRLPPNINVVWHDASSLNKEKLWRQSLYVVAAILCIVYFEWLIPCPVVGSLVGVMVTYIMHDATVNAPWQFVLSLTPWIVTWMHGNRRDLTYVLIG